MINPFIEQQIENLRSLTLEQKDEMILPCVYQLVPLTDIQPQ
jgi:hypothetical protein